MTASYLDRPATKVSPHASNYMMEMPVHFCPGCGHGSLSSMLSEIVEELDLQARAILVAGVGCGTAMLFQQTMHRVATPHGRASDVATGISRVLPDRIVIQYSGDGDACAIGLAGLLHACARRENFIVLIYNNNTYGMTGGQLGPTTCEVVPSTTFVHGRDQEIMGFPLDIIELVKSLPGCVFAARQIVTSGKNVLKAKRLLKRAFEYHLDGVRGIKLIDFLGNCNVNWKGEKTFTPITANQLIEDEVSRYFTQGIVKTPEDE